MADITATLTGQVTITGELTVPMGIVPRGEIEVTENGEYDVTNYETANVAVPQPSGSVTITANGQHDVTDFVTADVQVPQPSGSIEITENGTFDVAEFAQAMVNVQGLGWELLYEEEFPITASITSTSQETFAERTISGLYRNDGLVWVSFRRKEGKTGSYFYGSDGIIAPTYSQSVPTSNNTRGVELIYKKNNSSSTLMSANTSLLSNGYGYGLYPYGVYKSDKLTICSRYNATQSGTIQGTYLMQVYLLRWADGLIPTQV